MTAIAHLRRLSRPARTATRRGFRSVVRPVAYRINRRRFRRCALVFNFHQSTEQFDPLRHDPGTWTSIADLGQRLASIRARWPIVPLHDALAHVRDGGGAGWVAAVTFDDGDASLATHVAPLLERLDVPATLFINSAHLDDGPQPWTRAITRRLAEGDPDAAAIGRTLRHTRDAGAYDRLRRFVESRDRDGAPLSRRTVSSDWLQRLDPARYAVGLHGHEHQRFALMSEAWQRADLATNLDALQALPAFHPWFAVPFGRARDWTPTTIATARRLGLVPLLAHGGVHARPDAPVRRIPLDGTSVEAVLNREIAGL